MIRGQKSVVDMEISEILIKGAFSVVQKDQQKGFLNNLFLIGKQDRGTAPP